MKIEAVVVCVDYADFLAYTLLLNKPQFDRMVVVTTPADQRTRTLCEYYHVACVVTDAFYADGAALNKGRGINAGLLALKLEDWVVHMDADIALPPRAREMIEKADPDPGCIHGIDRMMCRSFEDWASFLAEPEVQHENEIFVHAAAFPMNVRIVRMGSDGDGWVPIGFFQMWHPPTSGVTSYPEQHSDAGRSDMMFALKWPRRRRVLIPEVVAVHLESEPGAMGTNWEGRKSRRFGLQHPRRRRRCSMKSRPLAPAAAPLRSY